MATQTATVFIVDDDEGVRESLGFLMKSVGLNLLDICLGTAIPGRL